MAEATIREAVADERVGNAGGVFQKARIRRRDPQRGQREKRLGIGLCGAVAASVTLKRCEAVDTKHDRAAHACALFIGRERLKRQRRGLRGGGVAGEAPAAVGELTVKNEVDVQLTGRGDIGGGIGRDLIRAAVQRQQRKCDAAKAALRGLKVVAERYGQIVAADAARVAADGRQGEDGLGIILIARVAEHTAGLLHARGKGIIIGGKISGRDFIAASGQRDHDGSMIDAGRRNIFEKILRGSLCGSLRRFLRSGENGAPGAQKQRDEQHDSE